MKRPLLFLSLLLLPFYGCGGGGGNVAAINFPLTTQTRTVATGDTATYAVSGTVRDNVTQQVANITGTMTYTVGSSPFNNGVGNTITVAMNLTSSNNATISRNQTSFFAQDNTRTMRKVGDNGGSNGALRVANAPYIILPGSWSVGQSYTNLVQFDNNDSSTETFNVIGTENVATPMGTFSAWKALETVNNNGGVQVNETSWYAPALATFVRSDISLVAPEGYTLTMTAVLSSTNIAL